MLAIAPVVSWPAIIFLRVLIRVLIVTRLVGLVARAFAEASLTRVALRVIVFQTAAGIRTAVVPGLFAPEAIAAREWFTVIIEVVVMSCHNFPLPGVTKKIRPLTYPQITQIKQQGDEVSGIARLQATPYHPPATAWWY